MNIDGQDYEFTRASDLLRDGMSLECELIHPNGGRTLLIEAFWHDPTGDFSVRTFVDVMPFSVMQVFLQKAAESLPPILSDELGTKVLVYVRLLDEGTQVWRPVLAEVTGPGHYRLLGIPISEEQWEFEPGSIVRCESRRFSSETTGLVAIETIAKSSCQGPG